MPTRKRSPVQVRARARPLSISGSASFTRSHLAAKLRGHRERKYNITRGVRGYFRELGIDRNTFQRYLQDTIARRGIIRIMDIGCGEGKFLAQLKKHYREKVFTAGIALSLPRYRQFIDELRIGMIEKKHFSGRFDVAMGVYSMEYAHDPRLFFERIYNSVRAGGRIFITFNANLYLQLPHLEDALKREGAILHKVQNAKGQVIALHIQRRSKKPILLKGKVLDYFTHAPSANSVHRAE